MPRHAGLSLIAATAAALVLVSLSLVGGATAAGSDCQIEAQPPTDYFGLIFGSGRVTCSAPANKITITVVLEKNGVEVARVTRNDCRKTAVCWNTTSNTSDEPGNQTWCSRAWGSATGSYLGEVRTCETGEF
jgi:hypothetical protein